MAVEGLKLSIEILLHVDLIYERVKAVAVVSVVVQYLDGDHILSNYKLIRLIQNYHTIPIVIRFLADFLAIDVEVGHIGTKVVNEQRWFTGLWNSAQIEFHNCLSKVHRPFWQRQ